MEKVFIEVYTCKTHERVRLYYCFPNESPKVGEVLDFGFSKKWKVDEVDGTDRGYMVFVREW